MHKEIKDDILSIVTNWFYVRAKFSCAFIINYLYSISANALYKNVNIIFNININSSVNLNMNI